MLLAMRDLQAIKAGERSLVFRRWRKPTVKSGGSLKTAVGLLSIGRVARISRSEITAAEASNAGYGSLPDLLAALDAREGEIYRIEVRFAGPDPRVTLREDAQLTESGLQEIRAKLARLDAASPAGPWTETVLRVIDRHPHSAAAKLAAHTGLEKDWLKVNIRKLKNLGLTISHEPGYELSPRGAAVLRNWNEISQS